ncbi:hypothetical protein [Gordonia aurantiaca]|uniref:hypothetical protein n=1 Tax=Gordonia sp. B21 TaxID=3151852 RepID=UPI003264D33E
MRALLTCGLLLTTATVGTTALWSTTAATTSGTFTTANIELEVSGFDTYTFTFPGSMLPGDSTAAVVNVQNKSSVAIRYSSRVSSGAELGRAMLLKVIAGGVLSGATCQLGSSGTAVVNAFPITSSDTVFDTGRGPLAATNGEQALCLQLTLPISAQGSLAGATSTVKFTFDASADS